MRLATTALERVGIALASLVLSVGLIALLSGYFAGHDPAGISGTATPLGLHFPDLGHAHLQPGELRPVYDSDPPTSGAHIPEAVLRDNSELDANQLLQALELGDVVVMYGGRTPPAGLQALARAVASGPFTPALAAAGQAVILARRPETVGLIALAWTRMASVGSVKDPLLRAFAEQWLGQGARSR